MITGFSSASAASPQHQALAPVGADKPPHGAMAEATLGFGDMIDVVNPLQHIPIVNNLYRLATGNAIHPVAKVLGGFVFGGPIGGLLSGVSLLMAQAFSGNDSEVTRQGFADNKAAMMERHSAELAWNDPKTQHDWMNALHQAR